MPFSPQGPRLLRAWFASAAMVAALSACSMASGLGFVTPPTPTTDAVLLQIPHDENIGPADGDTGALQGVLSGSISDSRACFWIDGPNGRAYVVTRPGWKADAALHLLDEKNSIVAEVGQKVLLAGAPGENTQIEGCPGSGRPWFTSEVLEPSPEYSDAILSPAK
jgi:hypothetical protein